MYEFYALCLFFIWKKLSLYRISSIIQIVFNNARSFSFAFSFVFFIFIRIIESIENSDSNHDIKRSNKIFESSLSFNDKIFSVFESSLSFNQNDRIYPFTTSLSFFLLLNWSFFSSNFVQWHWKKINLYSLNDWFEWLKSFVVFEWNVVCKCSKRSWKRSFDLFIVVSRYFESDCIF